MTPRDDSFVWADAAFCRKSVSGLNLVFLNSYRIRLPTPEELKVRVSRSMNRLQRAAFYPLSLALF